LYELESVLNPRDQAKESYAQRVVSTVPGSNEMSSRLDTFSLLVQPITAN